MEEAGLPSLTAVGPELLVLRLLARYSKREPRASEDCLYLNVWTRWLDTQARQPVMVWIHGGGYLGGGGCEDGTDGSHLAALGVTVVSFNYRLGAFDHLAHPELGSNFGLQDQIAALQWCEKISSILEATPNV